MQWLLRILGLDEDSKREARIEQYRRQVFDAKTPEQRGFYWRLMLSEIHERSPDQVKRMEKEQGLRA